MLAASIGDLDDIYGRIMFVMFVSRTDERLLPKTSIIGRSGRQGIVETSQIDQLVAPIALYPDTLFSKVLMASTYPLEVVQAERWLNATRA